MKLSSNLVLSAEILAAHKLRTLLSVLGIVVGVGAVVLMVSLGRGEKGVRNLFPPRLAWPPAVFAGAQALSGRLRRPLAADSSMTSSDSALLCAMAPLQLLNENPHRTLEEGRRCRP